MKGVEIMPIRIDNELPAKQKLEIENIFVMTNLRADTQDIRPLKIIILNLMPTKLETETQLLRLLSNSPLQLDIEFLHKIRQFLCHSLGQRGHQCTFSGLNPKVDFM